MALTWDARSMATGVEEIDAQHRELINHLNELFRLMHAGKAGDGLADFMDFLAQYAAWHFRHEEECMDEWRCPAAADRTRVRMGDGKNAGRRPSGRGTPPRQATVPAR